MLYVRKNGPPREDRESLEEVMTHVLEEARMVLPGIQALFGFQLMAVFNNRFAEVPWSGQLLHLIAMCAVTVSTALVIAPAAYHRQAEPNSVSERLVALSTRFLVLGMLMLTIGICLDIAVVAGRILSEPMAILIGLSAFTFFQILWFAFPRLAQVAQNTPNASRRLRPAPNATRSAE